MLELTVTRITVDALKQLTVETFKNVSSYHIKERTGILEFTQSHGPNLSDVVHRYIRVWEFIDVTTQQP